MNRIELGMSIAQAVALSGEGISRISRSGSPIKHGAVIMDGKRIISTGFNSRKTHPKVKKYDYLSFLHAETHAILKIGLEECLGKNLFVVRLLLGNKLGYSKPCPACLEIISIAKFKNIYYSTSSISKPVEKL